MRRSPLLAVSVALVLGGGLAGCGSTVHKANGDPITAGGTTGGLSVDGSTGTVDGSTGGSSGGSTGTAGGLAGSTGGGSTTSGSGGATGTSGSTGLGGGSGSTSGGTASKDPIKVGITYPDVGAIATIFGQDASENDPKAWWQRQVDYINKTGGVLGRPLKPSWYKADSAADTSTSSQQACTAFTQDSRVDIVINSGILSDGLAACLAKYGIASFDNVEQLTDITDMRRVRNRFAPAGVRFDRIFPAMIKVASQQGRLPRGAKLGVIVEDCPWGSRVYTQNLEPLAKQLGVTLIKGTHKCLVNLVNDLGPISNDMQREELRMFQQGATHVIFMSTPEAYVFSRFTSQAKNQNYFPKYLVTSAAYLYQDTRSDAVIKHDDSALPNTTGYGWAPLLDVGPLADPDGAGQKDVQAKCHAADPKEGSYYKDRGTAKYPFYLNAIRRMCDTIFSLRATLEASGGRVDLASVTQGYHAVLGGKLHSCVLSGGSFLAPPDALDGVGQIRPVTYNAQKKQFVFAGPAVRM